VSASVAEPAQPVTARVLSRVHSRPAVSQSQDRLRLRRSRRRGLGRASAPACLRQGAAVATRRRLRCVPEARHRQADNAPSMSQARLRCLSARLKHVAGTQTCLKQRHSRGLFQAAPSYKACHRSLKHVTGTPQACHRQAPKSCTSARLSRRRRSRPARAGWHRRGWEHHQYDSGRAGPGRAGPGRARPGRAQADRPRGQRGLHSRRLSGGGARC
jgi:hypothetical protein